MVLAALLKVTGDSLTAVRIFQILCGALSCCLIYVIGRRVFDRTTALLGGAIASMYPFFIRQDVTLYAESFFMLLYLGAFYFLVVLLREGQVRHVYLTGLFLGAAAAVKPAPLPLLPVLTIFLLYVFRTSGRTSLHLLTGLLALPLVILSPWIIRNAALGYGLRMGDSRDGITFYYGNSRFAEYYYFEGVDIRERYGDQWKEQLNLTAENSDSAYYYGKAFEYIRQHPKTALRLFATKIATFWRMWPHKTYQPLTILGYALVPPLGLLGLILFLPRNVVLGMLITTTFLLFTLFFCVYFADLPHPCY